MSDLTTDIERSASDAVAMVEDRASGQLDFSEASLVVVDELLDEASEHYDDPRSSEAMNLVTSFGNYILEVARREFAGVYQWSAEQKQPVLIVGEPHFHIAIMTWDKVIGRLGGDQADNIPFFYAGFANRARAKKPGDRALYV